VSLSGVFDQNCTVTFDLRRELGPIQRDAEQWRCDNDAGTGLENALQRRGVWR
jgi:hypothetical protein